MPELSRSDFKQIARWHGFTLVIEKEYDSDAIGKRKSFDFVYVGWEGSKYLYRLGWFWRLQYDNRTMKEVVSLLEQARKENP